MIELRGIGILDVKTLFGVESVKNTQTIDKVINLEDWDRDKEYDRLGHGMSSIQNFWAIKWSATTFPSGRAEIWRSS